MTDKEVGELWLWVKAKEPDPCDVHYLLPEEGEALIQKLVRERQAMHETNPCHCPSGDSLKHVLDDFGIDPATWKEEP